MIDQVLGVDPVQALERQRRPPAQGKRPQQPSAYLRLHFGDGFGTHAPGFMQAPAAFASGFKNTVEHDAMEVHMRN